MLTPSVAALLHEGLVDLDEVTQDGMRVWASAGRSSFRRPASLAECLTKECAVYSGIYTHSAFTRNASPAENSSGITPSANVTS